MSTSTKAGWAKAPCRLLRVEGRSMHEAAMRVESIERKDNRTTFIGVNVFTRQPYRLTICDYLYVEVL